MSKVLRMPARSRAPTTTASVLTACQVVPRNRFTKGARVRFIVHPGTKWEKMGNGTVTKVFEDGYYNVLGDRGGIFAHIPGNQVTPLPQN